MPTSSVLINPVRLRNIRDINPRDLIERFNQTIIKNVLNNELNRPGRNPFEPVPLLFNVVHSGAEPGFQVLYDVTEFFEDRFYMCFVNTGYPVFHAGPFVTNPGDRKSTRLNSSHVASSYAVVCLKNKKIWTIFSWILRAM